MLAQHPDNALVLNALADQLSANGELDEALALADQIAVLHEGRLQQVDTPQKVLAAPATPFVRELLAKPAQRLAAFRRGK